MAFPLFYEKRKHIPYPALEKIEAELVVAEWYLDIASHGSMTDKEASVLDGLSVQQSELGMAILDNVHEV